MAAPFAFGAPSFSFGQNTTPTTPSLFGGASSAASPSPFSPAPTTGAFGAPSFGTSTPSFGSSTFGSSPLGANTFGSAPNTPFGATASPSPFGATPTSTFGSTTFGSTQPSATPAFGSSTFPTSTPTQPSFSFNPLFGSTPQATQQQQQKPAFGFGATTAASPSPFGATPSTTTPFSFSSTPGSMGSTPSSGGIFGSTPTTFGNTTSSQLFSATPSLSFGGAPSSTGLFGAQPTVSGTASQKYTPTNETDNSGAASRYHSITGMPVYQGKSFEELRFEDYQVGRKASQGSTGGFSSLSNMGSNTTPSLFGQSSAPAAAAPAPSLFGQPATNTSSLFSTGTSSFGGASTTSSLFSNPSSTASPFSLTSPSPASTTPTFGSSNTGSPFPSFSSTTPSPFSSTAAPSTPSFSFSSPAPATSATPTTPLFGGTSSFTSTTPSTGFFAANSSANKGFNMTSPSPSPSAFSFSSTAPASTTPLSLFSSTSQAPAAQPQYILEASLTSLPFGSLPELTKLSSSRGPPEGPSGTPDPKKSAAAPGYKLLPRSAAKLKPRTFGRPNKSLFDSVMDSTQQNDLFVSRSNNIKKLVIDSSAVDSQPLSLPPLSSLTSLPLHEDELSTSSTSIKKSTEMRGVTSPGLQPPSLSQATASPKSPPRSSASSSSTSISTLKQLEIDDAEKPLPKKGVSRYNNYQEAYEKLQSTPPPHSSSPSPSSSSSSSSAVTLEEEKDLIPKLYRAGYFMIPSASEMSNMTERELMSISNFTIGLENVGAVSFIGKTDVRGLDLDEIVFFNPKELIMYPDEQMKPEVGQGLNKPAVVSLERCWPSNYHPDDDNHHLTSDILNKFDRKLRKITSEWGATFIKYLPSSGTWSFRVNHF